MTTPVKKSAPKGAVAKRTRAPKKLTVEQRLSNLEDGLDTVKADSINSNYLDSVISKALQQGDEVADAVRNCIQNDSDIITSGNIFQHCPSVADLSAVSNKVDGFADTISGLTKQRTWLWVCVIVLALAVTVSIVSPISFDPLRDVLNGSL